MNTTDTEWEDNFRKQFDELKLKPPKNSMKNAERELIIWYFRNLLTARDIYWKERVLAIIEKHDPSTNRETSPAYWGNTLREEIKSLR